MLHTKLNRPKIYNDLLVRRRLIEKLEKSKHQPLIVISAPTGYGKSVIISQWLEHSENNFAWLSLDKSMSDSAAFISYFAAALEKCSSVEMPELKNLNQDYHFLSWESIIDKIINKINELKDPIRLILDDYHLIRNEQIHMLIDAIISENINNFHMVIITRRDPPLQLRELRLYQKMLELRIRDLRFNEDEIAELLAMEHNTHFLKDEITELFNKTEGWILAIRLIMMTRSLLVLEDRKVEKGFLTSDLDMLVDHIGENLEPDFFKQVQLCSLLDQFNEDLIDSVFTYAFKNSDGAGIFLAKLKDLNLFLIATKDKGAWFRFHHLFGDILRRRLERNEPEIIKPLYIHISSWFAGKGLIDEAIHYMVMAQEYDMAVDLIEQHTISKFELGEWWVVKRWLENIPEEIRMSNVDLLLIELYFCQETYEVKEFSFLLETLEKLGVKNSSAKNQSLYLYHLGYYLAYIRPNPEKALECLEQSKSLHHDETGMFGARRELITANTRQMLGKTALALKLLDEHDKNFQYASVMHMRSLHARIYVHLLSGNFKEAVFESEKFHFIAKKGELKILRAWSLYLHGNSAFQTANLEYASQFLREVISYDKVFNYRVYFDALAGLVLSYSLEGDTKGAESLIITMEQMTAKFKNPKFQSYTRSVKARVNLHKGLGGMELEWAQMNWDKQTQEPYLFLMDVPSLTKISIIVSHGTILQVEEALHVLAEVKAHLDSFHNRYHDVDIELLKAMALLRVGRKELAKESLKNALIIAEKNNIIRPIMEAYLVMPSLLELVDQSVSSRRILSRIGLKSSNNELPPVSYSKTDVLSLREQQVIRNIAKGLRNKEIALQLNISTETVKRHLTNIYRKLDVPNRTSMLNKARNMNILS
ncbi:LuxR C-terminal-related transcriptional regulator [Maribellus sediminis]|uniref:LuxR C-terminal-related transcriptional regulator n=1 Tax=Maribellus sediminis TaxID=2696285 RepID=UPI00143100EC|nr:LuxR C-terminal-related transcriptional regulator [Maribellus sediminis]